MIYAEKEPVVIKDTNKISLYTASSIAFSLVSESNAISNGKNTCRDYINDTMRAAANGGCCSSAGYAHVESRYVDFDKLRLLIYLPTFREKGELEDDQRLSNICNVVRAIRIINLYEELAGWEEKSELHPVAIDMAEGQSTENKNILLLLGPERWMRSSQMVSMVTLIIRICVVTSGRFRVPELSSIEEVQTWWKRLCTHCRNPVKYSSYIHSDINTYLPACYELFPSLMKEYDTIFPPDCREVLLPSSHTNWHSCGGIYYMCTNGTRIDQIDSNINRLKKALKEGKQNL